MSLSTTVPYIALMVILIVGVDVAFFRYQFWPRLLVNVGIVAAFATFYLTALRHP
jgi:hypothetical protein